MVWTPFKHVKTLYEAVPDQWGRAYFWGSILVGFIPGAIMAWFAARLDWFWTALSWFGVFSVVLIVWLIVSIALAEYQRIAYRRDQRKALAAGKLGGEKSAPIYDGVYEGAHKKLMNFVVQYLFPAGAALEDFHNSIIRALCPNAIIADYARRGVSDHPNVSIYKHGMDGLTGLLDSPPSFVPLDKMIESVSQVEHGYSAMVKESRRIMDSGLMDRESGAFIEGAWEQYRLAHNNLVDAYERIKIDSEMGKLFRPARPSRWGGKIESRPGLRLPLKFKDAVP